MLDLLMSKEIERIGRGLLDVVSRHMHGNTEGIQENNQESCSPSRDQNQISPEFISLALLTYQSVR